MSGNFVEQAALALVGARFRLHGREPSHGLDCIGVAAAALKAAGFEGAVPSGYALRGGSAEAVVRFMDAAGLVRADPQEPGDILLLQTGPAQLHLAVRTARGFVHADARLRRVVETPGAPLWPLLGAWRYSGD